MIVFKDVNFWLMIFVIILILLFVMEVMSNIVIFMLIFFIFVEFVRFKGRIRFFNLIKNFLNEYLSGVYFWLIFL